MSDNDSLEKIVGIENVLDSPDILGEYSRDLSFAPQTRPRCVVRPATAGEIQAVVKWANETMTPLVPVSSGFPHFRGDTVPRMGGSVILDLNRMKRIIRVDPKNRVAMVEPGVTFGELQPELKKKGLSAYMPLCPRISKSVMGSTLEREPITMPNQHWDSLDPFLCAEIIFGAGDMLRSGEAAGPDSIEEQWKIGKAQMVPFGLGQFDESRLLSGAQGTIGITTWATMKCRASSQFTRTCLIAAETVEPLIDLSYRLTRVRLGDTCFIVNDLNLAALLAKSSKEIRKVKSSLPAWILVVTFEGYGPLPEEKVAYQQANFREMMSNAGNIRQISAAGGYSVEDVAEILSKPSEEPYWKMRCKGACADIFFLTTLDKSPSFIHAMPSFARSLHVSSDMGVYIQPLVQGTSCHVEFDIFYDYTDDAETKRVKSLVNEGARNLANMGAFFSRPYGPWARIAYNRASDTLILQRKVKKIFDPNNVLNPGRLCF